MSFTALGLSTELIKTLQEKGYNSPTPIQTKVIPMALKGRDILAAAQTGTGKTAAFALPIIQKMILTSHINEPSVRALIIVPTRELASQVGQTLSHYAKGTNIKVVTVFGGANISPQAKALSMGVDILIATPGRLLELNKQGYLPLWKVETLVFDEADTIFDMGFMREIEKLVDLLPMSRQNMLFSATMTPAVKKLSEKILNKPLVLEVDNLKAADTTLRQIVHPVDKDRKIELLSYLIGSNNYPQVLVFARTKTEADLVSKELLASGLKNVVIHGDKTHGARDRALSDFREGKSRILVATDIAARGLDIEGLDVVVNFDIPHVSTDYLHRIGRTGRAGNNGTAITLLSSSEHISWKKIETMLGKKVETIVIKGFEPEILITEQKKTRGKSMTKASDRNGTKGAFGKREKAPAQKKYGTKRMPLAQAKTPSSKSNKRD